MRVRDDLNRDVVILRPPQRIVSLVPSDTETLFALGVGDRVVGRTLYCVEPAGRVEEIPICGGTKDIDVTTVAELRPDLIICNQEENARSQLEKLARNGHQLFVSFPRRAADGIALMARLARILGTAQLPETRDTIRRGHLAIEQARQAVADGRQTSASEAGAAGTAGDAGDALRVFMPIWKDPLMTLSGDTFGSDMLAMAGAQNVFADRERSYPLAADLGNRPPLDPEEVGDRDIRYPRITTQEVIDRAPEAVLLPDEPFCFGPADADEFRDLAIPAAERDAIRLVSGKDLFWYGARTIEALPRLRQLIAELKAVR